MALPGSGPITFAQIATELGRTGTNVQLNQSDVAALAGKTVSSQIIMPNDFWGKSAVSDVTPNAVDWTNISGSGFMPGYNATTNTQTINGIDAQITLRVTILTIVKNGTPTITLTPKRNGANLTAWSLSSGSVGSYTEFTVDNGQTIAFQYDVANQAEQTSNNYVLRVTNVTDGGAILDDLSVAYSNTSTGGAPQ
jgi:hypothetical protein